MPTASERIRALRKEREGSDALLREIVLRTLERIADDAGVVRERPLYIAGEIMDAIALSDGGDDA